MSTALPFGRSSDSQNTISFDFAGKVGRVSLSLATTLQDSPTRYVMSNIFAFAIEFQIRIQNSQLR